MKTNQRNARGGSSLRQLWEMIMSGKLLAIFSRGESLAQCGMDIHRTDRTHNLTMPHYVTALQDCPSDNLPSEQA